MKVIEVNNDLLIKCPVCNKNALSEEEVTPCEHVCLLATDEGTEISKEGMDIIEEKAEDDGWEEVLNAYENDDLIAYINYQPAPSFFGVYVVFRIR